jgi:C1A family cysteine protease
MHRRIQPKKPPRRSRVADKQKRFYGWAPDLPDHRDKIYSVVWKTSRALPPRIDLRKHCPRIYSQGKLHSCTANAIGAAIEFDQLKQQSSQTFTPSRLFIYYNERRMKGTIDFDYGSGIREGIKTVGKQGVCAERLWPYKIRKFRTAPSGKCYREAKKHPALVYHRLRRKLAHMKTCLASGYPFIAGLTVYASFESKKVKRTGRAPMPSREEKSRGGHAVLVVGYEEEHRHFIVRNSWGKKWGMRGYFTLPYDYLTHSHLSDDFWTIKVVK